MKFDLRNQKFSLGYILMLLVKFSLLRYHDIICISSAKFTCLAENQIIVHQCRGYLMILVFYLSLSKLFFPKWDESEISLHEDG